jgi:autotransporter-associated beta strand protein
LASDNFTGSTGSFTVSNGASAYLGALGIHEPQYNGYFINGASTLNIASFFRTVIKGGITFDAVGGGTFIRSNQSGGGANFLPTAPFGFTTQGGTRCIFRKDSQVNVTVPILCNIALGTDPTADFVVNGASVINGGSIVKSGLGRMELATANAYSGTTDVNAGTLIVSIAGGLGTGATAVNSGGTLSLTASLTGTRTITANAGGVINRNGFAHTGTTFVNNGGTINL